MGNTKFSVCYCSFCGKNDQEVKVLIRAPTAFICDECVDECVKIVQEKRLERVAHTQKAAKESPLP